MKKLLILMILFPLVCFGQTRPHWAQLQGTPFRCVTEFGAKGDGETDDTAAIQAAVNSASGPIRFPAGVFLVSSPISIGNRRGLIGVSHGTWSPTASQNTTIKYVGSESATAAVLAVTTGTIGTAGTSAARTNVTIKNVTINANNLAGYGIWTDYLTDESSIENVAILNSNIHGLSINGNTYYNKFHKITARGNNGVGIFVGPGANANQFLDIRAHRNGTDYVADPESNAGIYLNCSSQNSFRGVTAESNRGPGVILEFTGQANQVDGLYLEGNNTDASVSDPTGLLIKSRISARRQTIRGLYMHGTPGSGNMQNVIATGTASGCSYLIEHPSQNAHGAAIFDQQGGVLTLVTTSRFYDGNTSAAGIFATPGPIYTHTGFVSKGTSGSTSRGRQSWQTATSRVVVHQDSFIASPTAIQIATFTIIQPGESRSLNASFDFTIGYNEYTGATRQAYATARGILLIGRRGLGGFGDVTAAHTLLLSTGTDSGGGNCTILEEELSTSIISGGPTETQTLGLFFTRSNNNFTPTSQSITINGTLTNASCGTSGQSVIFRP